MTATAIETCYNGRRFRSRLEARWAVYFDALEIEWDYEREGFNLSTGRYLPDFYLPKWKLWIEVRPIDLQDEPLLGKLNAFRNETGSAIMVASRPDEYPFPTFCWECIEGQPALRQVRLFSFVMTVGKQIVLGGVSTLLRDGKVRYYACSGEDPVQLPVVALTIFPDSAIDKSLASRFEYGEQG